MVRRALGELQLATIPRGEGDGDKTARLELYLRELRRFPPERVIRALRAWPKQGEKPDGRRPGRYFPSLDELIEFLTVPTRTAEHRVFGEHKALPNYSTRRDPRVVEGLSRLAKDLKSGKHRDPGYESRRRKAQWEIEAERNPTPNDAAPEPGRSAGPTPKCPT